MAYQFTFSGNPLPAALRGGVLACGLLATAATAAADAADAAAPSWKFSGFGTLGAVHASVRDADFTSTVMRANGAGRSERWSPDVDSRLGAQLDLALGRWSGVLQVVSEQNLEGNYRPRVEWANIKYQASPDLALRIGRIALPVFLAADYRKVGYTMPWIRPPVEVYGALPISSSDGVDATWRWSVGDTRHATQAFFGRTDRHLYLDRRLEAHGIAGLSHGIEHGPLSVRLSALTAHLTTGIGTEVFTALRAFGPQGQALAARYAIEHKRVSMASAGFSYDPGQWFVSAEAGHAHTHSLLGRTSTMYAGGGYRFTTLTPYLGFSKVRAHGATRDPGLPLASLPPQARPLAAALNAGLNIYLATIPIQTTVSTGMRWDLATDAALKLQYDRVRPTDGSRGTLINTPFSFRFGQTVHVASVALDFVF
ncbi:hypothetical protein LK542_12100 [Massilia sp. IC2-477]|uniref:hypothetical protein n=1 Tax=Massilia sp. IC2-477 TaxID=2887198 RepID=UPI001D1016F3|nr:hypothetical protein [Massilia sp. IC2-477]MCC2956358.1 hypothetical protein [Massilia sp. IC2-477]